MWAGDSPDSGANRGIASEIELTKVEHGFVIFDPKLVINGVEKGGGKKATSIEQLAEICCHTHFLRKPFVVTTISFPNITSSGYAEFLVSYG